MQLRANLIDFMVNLQEAALYESNKPSSIGSSFSDELGILVEIVTVEPDLNTSLLKLAYKIRVWLLMPQQALCFYQQALDLGLDALKQKRA